MNSSELTSKAPALSVVMPVHNALPYLDAAIESILRQTYSDFEFVILDDASTDGSTERLRDWAARDKRIRLLDVKENLGPAASSQHVAQAARAPLVARMDADDISSPDRLQLEIELLEANPDVGVVGCLADVIDSKGSQVRGAEAWRLTRRTPFVPFAHGAMMYRRKVFDMVGGYRMECVFWEDQDLVTRMAAHSDVLVLPRVLYSVRQSSVSTRFTSQQEQLEQALDLMYRCLERVQRGENYDDVLAEPVASDRKIDPRSYISIGSVALWTGRRPHLFRRLLRRGRLAANFSSVSALAWTAWASLSPGTLRPFLLLLVGMRNAAAKSVAESSEPVPWPLRSSAEDGRQLAAPGSGKRQAAVGSAETKAASS